MLRVQAATFALLAQVEVRADAALVAASYDSLLAAVARHANMRTRGFGCRVGCCSGLLVFARLLRRKRVADSLNVMQDMLDKRGQRHLSKRERARRWDGACWLGAAARSWLCGGLRGRVLRSSGLRCRLRCARLRWDGLGGSGLRSRAHGGS